MICEDEVIIRSQKGNQKVIMGNQKVIKVIKKIRAFDDKNHRKPLILKEKSE